MDSIEEERPGFGSSRRSIARSKEMETIDCRGASTARVQWGRGRGREDGGGGASVVLGVDQSEVLVTLLVT